MRVTFCRVVGQEFADEFVGVYYYKIFWKNRDLWDSGGIPTSWFSYHIGAPLSLGAYTGLTTWRGLKCDHKSFVEIWSLTSTHVSWRLEV